MPSIFSVCKDSTLLNQTNVGISTVITYFLLLAPASDLLPPSSVPDSVEDELELSTVRHRPEGLEQLESQTRFSRKELQILYRGFKNVRQQPSSASSAARCTTCRFSYVKVPAAKAADHHPPPTLLIQQIHNHKKHLRTAPMLNHKPLAVSVPALFAVGKEILGIFLLPSIIRSFLELTADRVTVTVSNQVISLLTFGVRNNEMTQN